MEMRLLLLFMLAIYIVVFLSAFGPKQSEKRFWKVIFRLRAGIDCFSRWFFNVCGAATLVIAFYYIILKPLMGL